MYKKRELKISMYCFALCIVIILTNCSKDFSASYYETHYYNEYGITDTGMDFRHPIQVTDVGGGKVHVTRFNHGYYDVLMTDVFVATSKVDTITFNYNGLMYFVNSWELIR